MCNCDCGFALRLTSPFSPDILQKLKQFNKSYSSPREGIAKGFAVPKYELMYIVGNDISDDEIPKITAEVKKFIETDGGIVEKYEELGKKKLAYPIAHTRNGFYIVANFSAPSEKINDIERKIRTSQNVIRHLLINMDEGLVRMEKDRVTQAKLKIKRPVEEVKEKAVEMPKSSFAKTSEGKKIEIDLDAEIEKALDTEDLK